MPNSLFVNGNIQAGTDDCFNVKIVGSFEAGFKATCLVNGKPASICHHQRDGLRASDVWHVIVESEDANGVILAVHSLLSPSDGMTEYLSGYEYRQVVRVRRSTNLLKVWKRELGSRTAHSRTWRQVRGFLHYMTETAQCRKIAPAFRAKVGRAMIEIISSLSFDLQGKCKQKLQDNVSAVAFHTQSATERVLMLNWLYDLLKENPMESMELDKARKACFQTMLGDAHSVLGNFEEALASYRHALSFEPDNTLYLRIEIGKVLRCLNRTEEAYTCMAGLVHELVKAHGCSIKAGELTREPAPRSVSEHIDED